MVGAHASEPDWRLAGPIEATTVGDAVARGATTHDHDALVFPGERVTHPELDVRVRRTARNLVALGVAAGDRVGILVPQGVEYLVVLYAAASIGAVGVPINARFKARELSHVVADSQMSTLVASDAAPELAGLVDLLVEAVPDLGDARPDRRDRDRAGHDGLSLPDHPDLRRVVYLGDRPAPSFAIDRTTFETGGGDLDEGELRRLELRVAVRQPAVLMYTSGTTANPKGALLSHEALVRKGRTVARTRFDLDPTDRVWTPLPLYHIGGIAFSVGCVVTGATYVHAGAFDADTSLAQLVDERCTVALPAFETIWLQILEHPDFDPDALEELRLVFNVGVPERLRDMQARLPRAVQVSGFGATESCSFVSIGLPTDDLDTRVTTCGRPLVDVDLQIIDLVTGEPVPAGQPGEICYRGPTTFSGYVNDVDGKGPGADGWFRSGDLGVLDADGRLTFVSRLKDMLKVGGENVAAAEVEGHLLTHPAVRNVQVVAAPDARYGEVAAAWVEVRPGERASEQELVDHCLGAIATFKVPRYVRFVETWPMSGTKIKKHVLRDRIAAELAERGITEAPKLSSRPRQPA